MNKKEKGEVRSHSVAEILPFFSWIVKLTLVGVCLGGVLFQSFPGYCETDPDVEPLPEIIAKTYNVEVKRKSQSKRVYLFHYDASEEPRVGRILLLKKENEPYLAFRILKTYPDKEQLAAKKVKTYGKHETLEDNESFTGIEKISDYLPPPPTPEDKADLAELEAKEEVKAVPFDSDLDVLPTPSPAPVPSNSPDNALRKQLEDQQEEQEEPNEATSIEVQQTPLLDRNIQWLTLGFGFVINNNSPANGGGLYYFAAGNLRYGVSVGRLVFFAKPHLQDSIVIEGGGYLYKTLGYTTQTLSDAYTLLSIVGNIRYNLLFSEGFGIFFYGGVIQSFVVSSANAQPNSLAALTSTFPAIGTGLLFEIGPGWFARVDIGFESMGLNLVLRF